MTLDCPSCQSSCTEVLQSRVCSNGTRRRRHHCRDCNYRWSSWDGPRPAIGARPRTTNANRGRGRRLETDEVRQILLAPHRVSNGTLGRQLGVSRESVRQIRSGIIHAKTHPELPRLGPVKVSCDSCRHFSGRCSYGFPEAMSEPWFAGECELHQLR